MQPTGIISFEIHAKLDTILIDQLIVTKRGRVDLVMLSAERYAALAAAAEAGSARKAAPPAAKPARTR